MQIVGEIVSIMLPGLCLETLNESDREIHTEEGRDGKSEWRKEGRMRRGNVLGVVKCTILIKSRAHFNSIMSLRLEAKGVVPGDWLHHLCCDAKYKRTVFNQVSWESFLLCSKKKDLPSCQKHLTAAVLTKVNYLATRVCVSVTFHSCPPEGL